MASRVERKSNPSHAFFLLICCFLKVTKLARDIADHTEEMTDRDHQILERRERIETINGEYRDRKTRRDELMNERKELW